MEKKKEKRPTQTERIYQYLIERGSITQLDALREFGCMRLASRICDLKRQGIKIKSKIISKRNMYGDPIKYAQYFIDNAG